MTSASVAYNPATARAVIKELMERSGQNILACYQCRRCAAGCPVGEESGMTPDRLIRLLLMGEIEAALENLLVWKCVTCYTCGTRCPNSIQTARITEALKHMSKERHLKPLIPKVASFHSSFVKSARSLGRFNEVEFMVYYEMENAGALMKEGGFSALVGEMREQAKLGMAMMRKKRMHMGREKVKASGEVAALFALADKKARK